MGDIALDVSGNPSTYQDTTLSIASLAANSEIFFWVKVTKGNDYMGFEPLQFNIHLEHD
jgi:hypothetical protein